MKLVVVSGLLLAIVAAGLLWVRPGVVPRTSREMLPTHQESIDATGGVDDQPSIPLDLGPPQAGMV